MSADDKSIIPGKDIPWEEIQRRHDAQDREFRMDEFENWYDTLTTITTDPKGMARVGWMAAVRYMLSDLEKLRTGDAAGDAGKESK